MTENLTGPCATRLIGIAVLLAASTAPAEEHEWETIQSQPIVVKARDRANGIKEIWAEGSIKGEVVDIQDVLTDTTRFAKYMPYMTEAREIAAREPDGAFYIYLRLDMPVLSPRDFIHKVYIDKDARQPWTKGVYASHWHAMPDKTPHRRGVIRLQVSEGSWLVKPLPNGKAHLTYKFSVDPGGMIPSVLSNMTNVKGPAETFVAVEREAALRASARLAKTSADAGLRVATVADAGR